MERVDGAQRTARLESFKRLQHDVDRLVVENAGFAPLVIGTLIWGFGDLAGRGQPRNAAMLSRRRPTTSSISGSLTTKGGASSTWSPFTPSAVPDDG